MSKGIDQSCPLSSIVYNVGLVDIHDISRGEDAIVFMGDMLLLPWAKCLGNQTAW